MSKDKDVNLKSSFLLFLTAAIWGFAFVAQRIGMNYIKPFTFNAIRFLLGSMALLPIIVIMLNKKNNVKEIKKHNGSSESSFRGNDLPLNDTEDDSIYKKNKKIMLDKGFIKAILVCGSVLFIAANLQQIGVVYTSATNAGFITGLYVVIVPFLSLLIGQKVNFISVLATLMAGTGLYFLSIQGRLRINIGDIYVFISSFFWAVHILLISKYSRKVHPLLLSIGQFFICGFLSLIFSFIFELRDGIPFHAITQAIYPLLYGGLLSIGVAYTLQAFAQQSAHPVLASIIMSLESVFAFIGGVIIINEPVTKQNIFGAIMMLLAMILAQLKNKDEKNRA